MNRQSVARQVRAASVGAPTHGILQRKCACGNHTMAGGECAECAKKKNGLQRKLAIGASHDPLEREADRVADQVWSAPPNHVVGGAAPRIQRFTGQATGDAGTAPASVDRVLASPGRPLEPALQQDMGQRFGYDFSKVRVHTGNAAEQSARDVSANAYTVGHNIVFGAGQYTLESTAGRRLFAHELTHVVQQRDRGSKMIGAPKGDVTDSIAPIVQRRLAVNPAARAGPGIPHIPLTQSVQGMLNATCPTGGAGVDAKTGAVTLGAGVCEWAGVPYEANARRADVSPTPAGCGCLCDVVSSAQTTTIDFRAGGPSTAVPPRGAGFGGVAASTTVHVDPRFQGQYRINGRWVDVPFHLLLSHEVCGHALPMMRGTHAAIGPGPAGGTPPHERRAVDVERDIAAEGGHPRRPEDYSGAARQRP